MSRKMTSQGARNSLERALVLLHMLTGNPGGLTNAEISRHMQIATSTCSYILARLERESFVRRDPETGRYAIGLKVVELSHAALREIGFREVSETALYRLAELTRLSAYIAVLERGHAVVVDKMGSPEFLKVDVDIGYPLPAHATALGKVLLAYLPDDVLRKFFDDYGLPKLTANTVVSKPKLLQELESVRKHGYAHAINEESIGVRAVAAPITDLSGSVRAAVSATGSSLQPVWKYPEDVIRQVKATALAISKRRYFGG